MSYRAAVVDDEKPARERIKRLLAEYRDFECVGEAASAEEAVRLIDAVEPDLVFLDVRMPEGDGFDVLRRVRRVPAVIFCTAYEAHAVRAFEVRSVDYLLKPFDRRRFGEALERARQALQRAPARADRVLELLDELQRQGGPVQRISAKRGTKILLFDPADVLWFEAEETLVFARTAEGRALVERTLADLERQLGPRFFRAHRGCLVNLDRVAEILPGEAGAYRLVFRDAAGPVVPLSRRQARRLRELIPW